MEGLSHLIARRDLLVQKTDRKPNKRPNELYSTALEVSTLTDQPLGKWLKATKNYPNAVHLALIAIKELPSRNKAAHFIWWFNKYKAEL